MSRVRTIAVVTGTRAEFGLLTPVLRAIENHPRLRLRLIVTGTHLSAGTWHDVRAAGFRIDARVPMQRPRQVGRSHDVEALGRGIAGIHQALCRGPADFVVVLGDRVEAFAAATAASVGGLRVAHIHGGDRAEGVADEAMRHAISKLAHLHLAATAGSRRRLIRMGEHAGTVFNVGSPAADALRGVMAAPDAPDVLVLQHPIGAPDADERRWASQTLAAVADRRCLVLAPNHDPGRDGVMRGLMDAAYYTVVDHLPRDRFLSLLAGARAIVGNSSAGLIEAAVLRVPCVNVGPRQAGRESPANVVHCSYGEAAVRAALRRALKLDLSRVKHPYGRGRAGERVAEVLATIELDRLPLRKRNAY
jgi:UDP-hydrolysing UDP-N-acetyl-D-glucosamine 2-epimerase